MTSQSQSPSRRRFLRSGLAAGAAAFTAPGAFAADLFRTPPVTEGPFYPTRLPLDTDNDLIIIGNSLTPAVGQITHLTGRVLTPAGSPVRGVVVEIWQCDANGVYLKSGGTRREANFQGFGKFETAGDGGYRFRTIKPVPYPGRAPHIHVKVKKGDRELLTTQILVRGNPDNAHDGVFQGAGDAIDRELVLADFTPVKGSKVGELAARFDIVLGRTPDDRRTNE